MKKKPDLSIVICTHNREKLLTETLASLMNLRKIKQTEVLVIDNNSIDSTKEVVAEFNGKIPLKYFFESKKGLSAARNRGITEAEGNIIAYLDDDAKPCTEWVDSILKAFYNDESLGAIGGKIDPNFEVERPEWLIKEMEFPYTIVDLGEIEKEYPNNLHPFGANMAIKKEVLQTIKFPENLGRVGKSLISGEESWLFKEMKSSGYKIRYIPNMSVEHFIPKERLTQEWILNRYYFQGISNYLSAIKINEKVKLLLSTFIKYTYTRTALYFNADQKKVLLHRCRLTSLKGVYQSFKKGLKKETILS